MSSFARHRMAFVGLVWGWLPCSWAAQPSFTGLGDLPGGRNESFGLAVSTDGSVVVGVGSVDAPPPFNDSSEAFRWRDGTMMGLGYLPSQDPHPFSGANGVSADGSVIVGSSSSPQGTNEPFRWENGMITGLGRIPGGWQNAHLTTGVSGDGQRVVGWGHSSDGHKAQAWLWDSGSMMGLGYLIAGGGESVAYAISTDGEVIVGESDSSQGTQAFRWSDGAMAGLGFLRSTPFPHPDEPEQEISPSSIAFGASADGAVIVGASKSDASGPLAFEAFRWVNGSMVGLGDLLGGEFNSRAEGVSGDGSVVVGYGVTNAGEAAFIWDSIHGMRELKDVLSDELGLDLADWNLTRATGISVDGAVIVGYGINASGEPEGFRAVLPEPSAVSVVLLGAVSLFRRRRASSRV